MRFLVVVAAFAVIGVASASILNRPGQRFDEKTWRIDSESKDHVTYVRTPTVEESQTPINNVDCNQTTTTPAPPTVPPSRRRTGSPSRNRLDVRSGVESSGRRKGDSGLRSQTPGQLRASNYDGYTGDHLWKVHHRTDDHITYTRRNSGSVGQGQGQLGNLRRIGGSGSDSVLARVVVPGKDDELTEEGILEGTHTQGGRGHATDELVHPYTKKTKATRGQEISRKSLRSGQRAAGRRQSSAISSSPPDVDLSDVDHPPRVGDELNGWVVISKSKDHISWERAGGTSRRTSSVSHDPAAQHAVANIYSRNLHNENRLKSLNTSRPNSGVGGNKRDKTVNKLIPNPQGELIEGFPRVFNTYSRAFFVNDRNIEGAGSIRTSLSDTSNWKVGDELAGWKVVSKDHRGIVWQRVKVQSPVEGHGELNEEDLLDELNRKNAKEESSESDSSSDSSSDSESNEGDNVYHGPGIWYLSKESTNSVTWKRDNTPEDVIFEMNDYPRIGDIQSGWKVKSKSRGRISWVRVNSQNESVESNEKQA